MKHLILFIYCTALLSLLSLRSVAVADTPSCAMMPDALRYVRSIRKLPLKRDVPCKVYSREEVKTFIQQTIEEELPTERIENEEYVFKTLGLIPEEFPYGDGLVELYLSQIGGFYDPKKEFFAMAGWMPLLLQMPIMVHELTHGLQDQHFVLDTFLDSKTMTTDQVLSRSALVEGDATAVMLDYARQLSGQRPVEKDESVSSVMIQNVLGASLSAGFLKAPESLRLILIFPYTSGLRFAHALLKEGSYAAIDKAFRNPPNSTREILHPEVYLSENGEQNSSAKLEKEILSANKSSRKVHHDSLGEFGLALMLRALGAAHQEASTLATGWRGDHVVVFRLDNKKFLEWRLQMNTVEDAAAVLARLQSGLSKKHQVIQEKTKIIVRAETSV